MIVNLTDSEVGERDKALEPVLHAVITTFCRTASLQFHKLAEFYYARKTFASDELWTRDDRTSAEKTEAV